MGEGAEYIYGSGAMSIISNNPSIVRDLLTVNLDNIETSNGWFILDVTNVDLCKGHNLTTEPPLRIHFMLTYVRVIT
jgi:hypothetical protein